MPASYRDSTAAAWLSRVIGFVSGGGAAVAVSAADPLPTTGAISGGGVASGAADSGNPVKVGGVYNSTPPTLDNGDRGDLQLGSRGSTNVTLMAKDSASEINFDGSTNSYLVDAATADVNATSVKASPGRIFQIEYRNVAAYDVFLKIYNTAGVPVPGTDAMRDRLRLVTAAAGVFTFPDGIYCSVGIAFGITKLIGTTDTTVLVAGDVTNLAIRYG